MIVQILPYHFALSFFKPWLNSGSLLVQIRLKSGSKMAQLWFKYGSILVQIWFKSGPGAEPGPGWSPVRGGFEPRFPVQKRGSNHDLKHVFRFKTRGSNHDLNHVFRFKNRGTHHDLNHVFRFKNVVQTMI